MLEQEKAARDGPAGKLLTRQARHGLAPVNRGLAGTAPCNPTRGWG